MDLRLFNFEVTRIFWKPGMKLKDNGKKVTKQDYLKFFKNEVNFFSGKLDNYLVSCD